MDDLKLSKNATITRKFGVVAQIIMLSSATSMTTRSC